ncbi:MAG: hypothetical protein HY327_13125 [Chloroflexi bacterium]|nr:hypothetical protein [Chloroflexota bacterium]
MTNPEIVIRPARAWDDYLAIEELQRVVWKMPDWRDAVPANLLITIQKNGGLVLGAFDGVRVIGFVLSFLGSEARAGSMHLKQCSHMLAVLPAYQSRGIGLQLKFAQRARTLAQELDLITWTFDPLQALNAQLNLWRLGATARQYIADAYGEMSDGLNAGVTSDRFQVEWDLNSPRVKRAVEAEPPRAQWDALVQAGAREIFSVEWDARGLPRVAATRACEEEMVLIEIPARITDLKAADLDLARDWRTQTRAVFADAFARGYIAADFVSRERAGARRTAYVLQRAGNATL